MLHTFVALGAGFAAVMLFVLALRAVLRGLAPSLAADTGKLTASYTIVNLGASFLAGGAGGYITAWIGTADPLVHVLALGIIVLALAALSALQARGQQPIWYQLAQVAIAPLGVLAGGLIRLRVLGIL